MGTMLLILGIALAIGILRRIFFSEPKQPSHPLAPFVITDEDRNGW
jgi:hypothetical protein